MAILSRRKFTNYKYITSGQVAAFGYEGKNYTVLVIDPKKINDHSDSVLLHAITLEDMSEDDIFSWYTTLNLSVFGQSLDSTAIYDKYKNSSLVSQRRYRTFVVDKIKNPQTVTFGQRSDPPSNYLLYGRSILVGITKNSIVEVNIRDQDDFITVVTPLITNSYYQGTAGHDAAAIEYFGMLRIPLSAGRSWELDDIQSNTPVFDIGKESDALAEEETNRAQHLLQLMKLSPGLFFADSAYVTSIKSLLRQK